MSILILYVIGFICIGISLYLAPRDITHGEDIYAKHINETLRKRNKTLSVAESCTGGGVAARLTSIPHSSEYFQGGLVAYQNDVKVNELGVSPETIKQYDVVSKEVVEEMVKGCLDLFNTDYAICTTGYADKSQNENIPDGTIWVGYGSKDNIRSFCITKNGGRGKNINNAITRALMCFSQMLA